jgi:uncharacterized iron-regulated protein
MHTARYFFVALALLVATAVTVAQPAVQGQPFTCTVAADHPLVGRIVDTGSGKRVSVDALLAGLRGARFVLLGEKHDNPDHHRLQAEVLRRLLAAGRHPAVAFEMLDADQAPAVARFLQGKPTDASGLAEAVGWQATSWPAWSMYQPIADLAVRGGLPIVAANFPEQLARKLAREGVAAIPEELTTRLGLTTPPSERDHKAMAKEIAESHCGYAVPEMIEPMILVQRARDEHMAQAVLAGATADGAVLITGFGHANGYRAVPARLRAHGAASVASLAFLEVEPDHTTPAQYGSGEGAALPYDFVWFTPRVDNEDPCVAFRAKLEKMKSMAAPPSPAAPSPTATPGAQP